jgi:hypothetical protein
MVRVFHGRREVTVHRTCDGRRQRIIEALHFEAVAGARRPIFAGGSPNTKPISGEASEDIFLQ